MFYKIRAKILHSRINELNKLVETQNDDIKMTRDHYADDLINLKGEVDELKGMAN